MTKQSTHRIRPSISAKERDLQKESDRKPRDRKRPANPAERATRYCRASGLSQLIIPFFSLPNMAPSFDNLSEDDFDVDEINFDGKKIPPLPTIKQKRKKQAPPLGLDLQTRPSAPERLTLLDRSSRTVRSPTRIGL